MNKAWGVAAMLVGGLVPTAPAEASADGAEAPSCLEVSVGPLFGSRSMRFEGDRGGFEHQVSVFLGASGRLRWQVVEREDPWLRLWVEGEGGGSQGTTDLDGVGGGLGTRLTYGEGRLRLERPVGSAVSVDLSAGLVVTSYTIEANPVYTGHRYVTGLAAVGVDWRPAAGWALRGEVGALPGIGVDHSSGAYGEGDAFGARLGLEARWALGAGWAVEGRYRFQRFRAQYPDSPVGSRGAISEDDQHLVTVGVAYRR